MADNKIVERILTEIKENMNKGALTTGHSSYTSGLVEESTTDNKIISRVLDEIKENMNKEALTTGHSSYTSGLVED